MVSLFFFPFLCTDTQIYVFIGRGIFLNVSCVKYITIFIKATDHNFVIKFSLKNSCKTCTCTQKNVNFREISTL